MSVQIATLGFEDGGSAAAALPWVSDAPVAPLARVLFRTALPDLPPTISSKRQAQLEAAAHRLDYYGGPGEWIRFASGVLSSWQAGGPGPWLSEPPRSLGALALELRREANVRRHGALERRTQRLRPLAAARERQKVKRWRADVREHERIFPGAGRNLRRPRDA